MELERGWMRRQAEDVQRRVNEWPEWLRRSHGIDQTPQPAHPTPREPGNETSTSARAAAPRQA